MSTIKKFLDLNDNNPLKIGIAVVGDCMIDQYYQVTSNRLSPEFPIPVMLSEDWEPSLTVPGGTANVIPQFKYFNVNPILFGFSDKTSREITECRQGLCGEDEPWIHNNVKLVPQKKRFYAGDFPLCRWDVEKPSYGTNAKKLKLIQNALYREYSLIDPKVTILSDYNKGFWTEYSRNLWLKDGRLTIVDPKKGPVSKWKGCTIFKPNSKEALELTGLTDWRAQADYFMEQIECKAAFITQGGDGVVGKIGNRYFKYRPRKPVVATSVIGAGDCFMAFMAMGLGQDMTIEESVELAFEAGAVYVQNKHNKPISAFDLLAHDDHVAAKIVKPESLAERDFTLCFTNGCFDILHKAHLDILRYSRSTADKLVVALNTDESVQKLKGPNRPVNSLENRIYMLSMFEFVDYLVFFDEDTPLELIKKIKPDIIVKGGDYTVEQVVGHDIVPEVRIFPYIDGLSTTSIVERIRN